MYCDFFNLCIMNFWLNEFGKILKIFQDPVIAVRNYRMLRKTASLSVVNFTERNVFIRYCNMFTVFEYIGDGFGGKSCQ